MKSPESTCSRSPLARTMGIPESVAIRAASSFETIPPTEVSEHELPHIAFKSSVMAVTSSISVCVSDFRGSQSYSPSTLDNITSRSACIFEATTAESVSLSPKLISSTAIVSFSLIMGTVFS